ARQFFAKAPGDEMVQSGGAALVDLTATLLSGWSLQGGGDTAGAVDIIGAPASNNDYAVIKDLHAGLILDLAGKPEAGERLERAFKQGSNALRTVEGYARWLSRNGKKDEALSALEAFDKVLPRHPL